MHRTAAAALALAAASLTATAQTGPVTAAYDAPDRDRWNYPFNLTPGVRANASTFGAVGIDGFDDRDAQVLVGYDLAADFPAVPEGYRVVSATVELVVLTGDAFIYDPTQDPIASFFDPTDADFIPDDDDGRPIELFATGYRNGLTIESWEETTPFTTDPTFPPPEDSRSAYAAIYQDDGTATDLSNQVRDRFDATPLAVGVTDAVAPGELVPAETVFRFELNPCAPGAGAFFDASFDAGRLHLTATGHHSAVMGTTDPTFPVFIMRENPLASALDLAPKLTITAIARGDADLNADGVLDIFDFLAFQNAFDAGEALADFDGNCSLDIFDFLAFQNAFDAG